MKLIAGPATLDCVASFSAPQHIASVAADKRVISGIGKDRVDAVSGVEVLVRLVAPDQSIDESQLLAWCKKRLASFQCPSRFIILDELPVGDSGKIDKLALAQRAKET